MNTVRHHPRDHHDDRDFIATGRNLILLGAVILFMDYAVLPFLAQLPGSAPFLPLSQSLGRLGLVIGWTSFLIGGLLLVLSVLPLGQERLSADSE